MLMLTLFAKLLCHLEDNDMQLNSASVQFDSLQKTDETGSPEEFTNDLGDIVNIDLVDISHLDCNGLPLLGATIKPGMILVGKIGRKMQSNDKPVLSEIERQLLIPRSEMTTYWTDRFYDASLYVPDECFGSVGSAIFIDSPHGKVASVVVNLGPVLQLRDA
ncbi:MAG: hypothetical protein ACRCZF_02840 [Gemmataceae bacterium]